MSKIFVRFVFDAPFFEYVISNWLGCINSNWLRCIYFVRFRLDVCMQPIPKKNRFFFEYNKGYLYNAVLEPYLLLPWMDAKSIITRNHDRKTMSECTTMMMTFTQTRCTTTLAYRITSDKKVRILILSIKFVNFFLCYYQYSREREEKKQWMECSKEFTVIFHMTAPCRLIWLLSLEFNDNQNHKIGFYDICYLVDLVPVITYPR